MIVKILNLVFATLIVLILSLVAFIILISPFEGIENNSSGLQQITGTVQNYEVYHKNYNPYYIHIRKSERYDDKFLKYLDSIHESRDKTFFR